jgi:hypothetical protein
VKKLLGKIKDIATAVMFWLDDMKQEGSQESDHIKSPVRPAPDMDWSKIDWRQVGGKIETPQVVNVKRTNYRLLHKKRRTQEKNWKRWKHK